MRIQVYEEQYKTKTPYVEPGKVANEQWANAIKGIGKTITGAIDAKLEKDDAIDSARLEADTRLAAERMQKEFQETANPDDFEGDITRQKELIQNLIKDQSKKLRLSKNQNEFYSKMTRSVEPAYMGETLNYAYNLQEQTFKDKVSQNMDSIDAMMMTGSALMTLDDAIGIKLDTINSLHGQYKGISNSKMEIYRDSEVGKTVTAWATYMTQKDPQLVIDTLMGVGLSQFMAAKEAAGTPITVDQFLQDDNLREEYRTSEFGAKYTDRLKYLPYPTRVALVDRAILQRDKDAKDKIAAAFADNANSADENERALQMELDHISEFGIPSANYGMPHIIDGTVDPALSINGGKIDMGKATHGDIQKGNSVSTVGQTFADGLDGTLVHKGIRARIESDTRPTDKGSKHKDSSATDLNFLKNGTVTMQSTIEGYKTAIQLYGKHIPKKGVLIEFRNSHLSKADKDLLGQTDVLDYMKAAMEKQGIDTSWIDWENSKKFRMAEKWSGNHVHFTRDKNADYTKMASAGEAANYTVKSDLAFNVYQQKRAEGKTPQKAFEAARKVDMQLLAAWHAETMIRDIVVKQNKDGTVADPSEYESAIDTKRAEIYTKINKKQITTDEGYLELEALKEAKERLPKYIELYQKDPVKFVKQAYKNVTNNQQAAAVLAKGYGMDANTLRTMTNDEATTLADQLQNKLPEMEAIKKIKSIKSEADLRQIAQHLTGTKGNILLWSGQASEKMQFEMAAAMNTEKWKEVELGMKDKSAFPTSWKNTVRSKLNKNSSFKKFVSDYEMTQPGNSERLYDAMLNMYAYEKVLGGMGDASDTDIINYLVGEIIDANTSSISVRSPRDGATDLRVSKNIPNLQGHEKDLKKVINIALEMGIDDKQTYVIQGPAGSTGYVKIDKAINDKVGADITRQRGAVRKNTTATSLSNGTGVKFMWKDPTSMQNATPIMRVNNTQPATISYEKALSLDKQVNSEIEKYRMSDGTYALTQKVNNQPVTMYVSRDNMYKRFMQYHLSQEYPWLHKALVTDITTLIEPKNKYRAGTDRNIDAMVQAGFLDEKGAEAMNNAKNQVIYKHGR